MNLVEAVSSLHRLTEDEILATKGKGAIHYYPYFFLLHSEDEFLIAPDESHQWRYVIQLHFRGKSVHGDLRLERKYDLLGWTLLLSLPKTVTSPVMTLDEARKVFNENEFKIDFENNTIRERKIKSGIVREGEIQAVKKAPEPKEWLFVEGVSPPGEVGATRSYPGVFLIADKGIVEYGSQQPHLHEYFFQGERLSGRWFFRILSRELKEILPPGNEPEPENVRSGIYWVLIHPEDQTPYVLSQRAVEKGYLPPHGMSAIPKQVREKVPKGLRYWQEGNFEKALAMRNELVSLGVAKFTEMLDLKLHYVSWKRTTKDGKPVIVIRPSPSTQYYLLTIGNKVFECESNPLETDTPAVIRPGVDLSKYNWKNFVLPAGSKLNPTKNTVARISLLTAGKTVVYINSDTLIKFSYRGKTYVAKRLPGESVWNITASDLHSIDRGDEW